MNSAIKNLLLWLLVAIALIAVFNNFGPKQEKVVKVTYTKFLQEVDQGSVVSVNIEDHNITAITKKNTKLSTYLPLSDQELLKKLISKNIDVKGIPPEQQSMLVHILINWAPMLLLIGFWLFFMRQISGGGKGGPMYFGKSKAKTFTKEQIKITFADVAGIDEAKAEVSELVDFLKNPGKYKKLGGKVPCGVLLLGPPGTGKTLLAKAVAGEAKVAFYFISGSDFVEMFVGVGASRVRDLFEVAKKNAPCIIFIDEIDAVGRHRGAGIGGGHDEREHTLNQLLVEMDGFMGKDGVIVVAATNRPDVLDPALLRPGRFDRTIVVPLPDICGREKIILVHMKKLSLDESVNASILARGTPGLSGADLANLVNEAALFAAKANKKLVTMADFEKARDKVLMGTERRSMVMTEKEKRKTACHEAGHAIVSLLIPEHDPIYKVTIIPRGFALGITMFLPIADKYSHSLEYLNGSIICLFGGRIAESLIFGVANITTGASNDIARATDLARNMVTKWGLSVLGPIKYVSDEEEIFLGRSVTHHKVVSDVTAAQIDQVVKEIIDTNYQKAENILRENIDKLNIMMEALIKYETLEEKQVKEIMEGKPITPPEWWHDKKSELQVQQDIVEKKESSDLSTSIKTDEDIGLKYGTDIKKERKIKKRGRRLKKFVFKPKRKQFEIDNEKEVNQQQVSQQENIENANDENVDKEKER